MDNVDEVYLAATVGVLGFIVTKRPLAPLGNVRVCA